MIVRVSRRESFNAAHQLCDPGLSDAENERLFGKCANLHGHRYTFLFTVETPELDPIGRVVDFSVLAARLGSWLNDRWDHAFLWFADDIVCEDIFKRHPELRNYRCPFNPTAENMANFLLRVVGPEMLAGTDAGLRAVTVYETENCSAHATMGP